MCVVLAGCILVQAGPAVVDDTKGHINSVRLLICTFFSLASNEVII